MLIDCHSCTGRGSHCHDCVISFLLDQPAMETVELTADELGAMEVLADQGIVPPLRLELLSDSARKVRIG